MKVYRINEARMSPFSMRKDRIITLTPKLGWFILIYSGVFFSQNRENKKLVGAID